MTGKTLQELTTTELRSECTARGISISGSKPDLMIRLEENIRRSGQDPANVRFSFVQPLITGSTSSTEEQPYATSTLIGTVASQFDGRPTVGSVAGHTAVQTHTGGQPELSEPPHLNQQVESAHNTANNVFQTAAEQLHMLKQTLPKSKDETSFEARLMALEASLSRFLLESRSTIAQQPLGNTAPRFEIHPSPVQVTTRVHEDYQSGASNVYVGGSAQQSANHITDGIDRPFFTRDTFDNRTGHTTGAQHYAPYNTRAQERSVLIPYDDLRAARSSLPKFSGTRAEDPVRYIQNTESILTQARIHPAGWCRAVEPQLKGTAGTWYTSIKVLDLSWEEFRVEFFENFDNSEIQSQLRADIVSTRQTPTQSLTEFVLIKNQLARRVNTGLSESELVGIIAGLTRDKFRTHIRLHRPLTFSELRRIAGVLDPVTTTTNPTTTQWTPRPKKGWEPPQKLLPVRKKVSVTPSEPKPSRPCRYCGELHWHSECPHKPTRSGNGGGVDGD
jgi:hypothetical protein